MDIAIDFDGTCVTHEYPEIGESIGAEQVLRKLVEAGHNLILFTMRSDNNNYTDGKTIQNDGLTQAVNWFKDNEISLYGVQRNPTQDNWTQSPKCYAHLYIDDAALGCPLISTKDVKRPFVDWIQVEKQLTEKGIL